MVYMGTSNPREFLQSPQSSCAPQPSLYHSLSFCCIEKVDLCRSDLCRFYVRFYVLSIFKKPVGAGQALMMPGALAYLTSSMAGKPGACGDAIVPVAPFVQSLKTLADITGNTMQ